MSAQLEGRMTEPDFYRVEWTPEAAVTACAKENGWNEGDDDYLAKGQYETKLRAAEFKSYRLARRHALRVRHEDLWKQARLYECIGEPDNYECTETPQIFESGEPKAAREYV